jgi:hypothetical protein
MLIAGWFADVCQKICIGISEAYPRRSDEPADVDCRSSLPNKHPTARRLTSFTDLIHQDTASPAG